MKQSNNENAKIFFEYSTGNDQEPKFIQNYYGMHKNIKVQFKNKKYRKIYQLLIRQAPQQDQYMTLYYQDLLISIIKLTRIHVIRQLSNGQITEVQNKGIKVLRRFYSMLVSNDCYLQGTYKINKISIVTLTLFLTFVIDFTTNLAAFFQTFDCIGRAKKLYNNLSSITNNVAQSSTSNPLILRKCYQNELFLSQLFYVRQCYPIALQHLKKALKLQFNEIYIANMLKKVNKKLYKKEWNAQRFFMNLKKTYATLCLVLKKMKRFQLLFEFLNEILLIQRHLNPMNKSRLITSPDWVKIYQTHYLQHKQLTEICQYFFDSATICSDYSTQNIGKNHRNIDTQNSEQEIRQTLGYAFAFKQRKKHRTKLFSRMESFPGRGSFSGDNIDDDRIMLFGENFWEAKKKILDSVNQDSYSSLRKTMAFRTLKGNNTTLLKQNVNNVTTNNLKKKRKKVEFKKTNKLQRENHMPYEQVCRNVNKLVEDNIKDNNILKSRIYKLRAKQQSKSIQKLKSISEGNHEGKGLKEIKNIIMCVLTEQHKLKFQQLKSQQNHETDKSTGLNLFRSIILKHKNTFGIKKIQLFQPQIKSTIHYSIPTSNQMESKATAISRAKRNLDQFIQQYKVKLVNKKQQYTKQPEQQVKCLKASSKYKTMLEVSNMEKSRLFQSTLNKWIEDNFEDYQSSDQKILDF